MRKRKNKTLMAVARKRLALTIEEMAAMMGVSTRTIYRWESGSAIKDRDRLAIKALIRASKVEQIKRKDQQHMQQQNNEQDNVSD